MKKIFVNLAVALSLIILGCSGAIANDVSQETVFRSVEPAEAMRMLQQRDDIIFLDVRTPRERSRGYIPGSKLVAFNDIALGRLQLPEDKPILLVCAVGGRSYFAGQILSKKGYREIYNLSGGVKKWYQSGLPLTYDKP